VHVREDGGCFHNVVVVGAGPMDGGGREYDCDRGCFRSVVEAVRGTGGHGRV